MLKRVFLTFVFVALVAYSTLGVLPVQASVAPPEISPDSRCSYFFTKQITMTSPDGAEIYYTILNDKDVPQNSSPLKYTVPILMKDITVDGKLARKFNIKAYCKGSDGSESSTKKVSYESIPLDTSITKPSFYACIENKEYTDSFTLQFAYDESKTHVYFTTDGSLPTNSSILYNDAAPPTINKGDSTGKITIKAVAVRVSDGYESDVLTGTFTIKNTKTATPTPTSTRTSTPTPVPTLAPNAPEDPVCNLGSGYYSAPQTVKFTCETGATIYYTTNDTEPSQYSNPYTSSGIKVNGSTIIKAVAYKNGVPSNTVTVSLYYVSTPTVTVSDDNVYSSAQTVSFKCDTSNVTFYYTTDGSAPTKNSSHGTYVVIDTDTVLKVVAYNSSGSNFSDELKCDYTINYSYISTPTATVDSSGYVTLSCPTTSGASIYYTTDNSEPDISDNKYTSKVYVGNDKILKAIAYYKDVHSSVMSYTPSIDAPTANITSGAYSGIQTVTLNCSTSGMKIYYTLDRTAPTKNSTYYDSSIKIDKNTTLTVIAYNLNTNQYSSTNTYTYTFGGPLQATANIPSGTYNGLLSVSLTCATPNALIYYTLDGSDPTTSSICYSVPIQVTSQTTIKAAAYYNSQYSEINTYNYTFGYQNAAVEAAVANIQTGTYSSSITVKLSCPTVNTQIFYTTDGSEPTSDSTFYESPITISSTTTLKVVSYKSNLKSGINTYYYTINYGDINFTDLDAYNWAKDQVLNLAKKGIIKGTSQNTFSPSSKIKRADFICLLVRTLGLNATVTSNFDDVSTDEYYYNEVGIARELGITKGVGGNKISPRSEISRQDMMVLVSRALVQASKIQADGTASDISTFSDADSISSYAVSDVATLIKAGIVQGSGNVINPKGTATRVETAVIMYRILNK